MRAFQRSMVAAFLLGLGASAALAEPAPAPAAEPGPASQPTQPQPAENPQAPAPQAAAPATVQGEIARATITSGVTNREPVDDLTSVPNTVNKVYFFTELDGMKGVTISHRWEYNGKVMATVDFHPQANRWRVWSSKQMLPQWTGKWTVDVVDTAGDVLKSVSFDYTEAAGSTAPQPPGSEPPKAEPAAMPKASTQAPPESATTPPL